MNWLDIVILIAWASSGLWGFSAGVIQLVFPLVGLLVGLAVASRIGETVGQIFSVITDNENAQTMAGFFLILAVCTIGAAIIGFMLRPLFNFIPIAGMANRVAGLVVGIAIGFVLLSGIFTGLQKFPVNYSHQEIAESRLASFLANNFDTVLRGVHLIPADWDDQL